MNRRYGYVVCAVLFLTAGSVLSCGSPVNPVDDVLPDVTDVISDVAVDTMDATGDISDLDADRDIIDSELPDRDSEITEETDVIDCPGGYMCPCEAADDCYSNLCVPGPAGKVCSRFCSLLEDECPTGWQCKKVNLGAEALYGCVYPFTDLCKPCQTGENCKPERGDDADIFLCVEFGPEGSFCGAECTRDTDCPDDYQCEDIPFNGDFIKQCMPTSGTCACTEAFAADPTAITNCFVENDIGTCFGTRTCATTCDAATPVAETCNLKDDDCNGATDDKIAEKACPLTNLYGTCPGKAACVNGSDTNCQGTYAAPEICDGFDQNCDGTTDNNFPDDDTDGLANCIDPDIDGDGILNAIDNCPSKKNPLQENNDAIEEDGVDIAGDACDTDDDNDGIPDTTDNCQFVKNVGLSDIDGDRIGDACDCDKDDDGKDNPAYLNMLGEQCTLDEDNCPTIDNADQADLDVDGAGNVCDCDIDDDDVANNNPGCPVVTNDNCAYVQNVDQIDTNSNNKGDACDCDADSDGVANNNPGCTVIANPDNCVLVANLNQRDIDHDGDGDACDCDIDDDLVMNNNPFCPLAIPEDNCPFTPNPDQDPILCDNDWDGDGIVNEDDNCPYYPNSLQEDADIDGIGDVCDCDADSDNILNVGENQEGTPCIVVGTPDNCALIANVGQDDLDTDHIGDACDCDIDGDDDPQAGFGCPTPAVPDCEPYNPLISKFATEKCNSIDDNCNGQTDELGAIGCTTYYYDNDNDTYGSADFRCLCAASGKYKAVRGGDCDDSNPARSPGVQEVCNNGIDDNCNGSENDENAVSCVNYYFDGDTDNWGTSTFKCLCTGSADYRAKFTGDCDDNNPGINPGQKEICYDNKDNDCSGSQNDIQALGCKNFYYDADNDTYGTLDTLCLCVAMDVYRADKTNDCDDDDVAVHPNRTEICNNGKDDNCDGVQNTVNADGCISYFFDGDGDTYGAPGTDACLCGPDTTHTATIGGDCKDSNDKVNPGAIESCNNIDDNCSGATDENPDALCPSNETLHSAMTCYQGVCTVSGCNAGWFDVDGSSGNGCECAQDGFDNTANDCASAIDLGTLSDASTSPTIVRVGKIVPNSDFDWYKIKASDTTDTGASFANPGSDKFRLIAWLESPTDESISIEVHPGTCNTAATCGGVVTEYEYNVSVFDKANLVGQGSCINDIAGEAQGNMWQCCAPGECGTDAGSSQNACCGSNSVCQGPTNPYNIRECNNDEKTFFIKVYRASGSATSCAKTEYELRISNGKPRP